MADRLKYDPKYSQGDVTVNPIIWDDQSLATYLRVHHNMTLSQIRSAQITLASHKFEESSIWQTIVSYLWYGYLRDKFQLTPESLLKILTNLDKLLPFIPNKVAQDIIVILDRVADALYEELYGKDK